MIKRELTSIVHEYKCHESDERLTHAQTTSTRPSCLPNRYKSENSVWDRGYNLPLLYIMSAYMCTVQTENV